jgi:hypothetical protein
MNQTLEEIADLMRRKRLALACIALAMHQNGDSLREIGRKLSISHELARQLIRDAPKDME